LDKEPAIIVCEPDAARQPTPQDHQLMSKHRVLSLKPQLRLERQRQDGQNETEQPDHSASSGDSITSSTRRVGLINRAADLAISPVSDEMQWGVADHWSDPFETLRSNRGDCEDYAILKYAALQLAGIPKDDVKIVILRNVFPSETHAAVATRVDGQWLILDNRTLTLVPDTDVTRAIPEFVLDHEGVKRFSWAGQNRRVGS
jgi:predicted transglutaminase-like cysteine proteinase